MALPVMKPERRRSPRIILGSLAYITFESNTGGIVVNISDEGLCFHTIAPVGQNETIHFWFSAGGRRVEAEGRLIWTDDTRKSGGLRFSALSAEASQQIRNWIVQSSEPIAAARHAVPAPSSHAVLRSDVIKEVEKGAIHHSATQKDLSRWLETLARWGEFSRGLATGILIAAVVAGLFLFHAYKHQIGESLIGLGERFAATPHSAPPSPASASPQVVAPTVRPHVAAPASLAAATSVPVPNPAPVQPPTKAANSTQAKLEPKAIAPAISLIPSTETLPPIDFGPARPSPPPPAETAGIAQPESADRSADKTAVMAVKPAGNSVENPEDIAEINSGVPFGRYFDLGNSKDELGAHNTMDDLARIGVHAFVIPKHHLWMNSYQVIAGPYRDQEEMQAAGTNLRSHGFKTHSLPKQSRGLTLLSSTAPHGSGQPPTENLIVNWETYSPEVTVNFVKGGDTVTKTQGTWVRKSDPYGYDAIVYKQNGNGSRTLLEIWFHGMNRAVVLPTASPNHPVTF